VIALALLLPVIADDFERGLSRWPATQQIDGRLDTVPGRGGKILRARTGPRGNRVPKAALIARPALLPAGTEVRIAFDLMVPQGAPLNSIHLADVECATCGEAGNPGIRLYLRHGRLRIDRSKIGIANAWTNDAAPQLRHGHWHHVELDVRIGFGDKGRARVRLDGAEVLAAKGDTILRRGADRIQIGLTASSNPVPATAYFDNVRVDFAR
jgi:hypothetical protein